MNIRPLFVASLVALLGHLALSQSHEPFTGTQQNDLGSPQVQKWVKMPGQLNASASVQRFGDGTGGAYHPTGTGYPGLAIYDTALTTPFQVSAVVNQLSGTTTDDFVLFVDDNSTFATGGGYVLRFRQQTGADILRFGEYNQYTSTGGVEDTTTPFATFNTGNFAPSTSFQITKDIAVGDTLFIRIWSDRMTAGVKSGLAYDTVSITRALESSFNVTTGSSFRVGFGARVRTTPFKINDFFITVPGAASPPPSSETDLAPPVAADPLPSRSSATLGQAVYFTFAATDDSALNAGVMEVDTGGGYNVISTQTISGTQTSYAFTSPTFTRYTAGTATLRARLSDHRGRLDTSNTATVTFAAAPASSQYAKKVYGYLTFSDTRWTGTGSGVPADSLPWEVLTHVGLFAANGANPPQSSYINQLGPMATRAHASGVFAGLCVGGSSDGALVTLMSNPASWTAWINTYLSYIDTYGIDFLDFDLEGTYTAANVGSFFAQFKDSLDTRLSTNDPTRAPFIVLTVGMSRAASWGATATIRDNVEFVNIMSYDFIGSWWGRLIHDNAPKSYQFWNGTGTNTDFYAGQGVNSSAPSYQEAAKRAIAGGWPASKVLIGFDANPTYYYSTATSGRGPLYIRQPVSEVSGYADATSNPDFSSTWPTMAAWPTDSINFDQIAQSYWIHTGTGAPNDRVWVFTTMPGRDSGVIATRKVVDSMNIGGVMIWNLGSEIWNTSSVPSGGRGWFFSQLRQHFSGITNPDTTCNPPALTTPLNGATAQALATAFNWPDVACAAASAGYNIQVDNNDDFSSPLKDTIVTPSALALAAGYLSNSTTYSWRVRVKDATSGIWGGWSAAYTFTTVPVAPGAPTITFPINGQTLGGTQVLVLWTASANGPTSYVIAQSFYEIHVSTSPTFTTTFKRDSTTNLGFTLNRQYNLTGMANSTVYYIRTRSKTAGGYSPWSTTVSITTGAALPDIPLLAYPPNNIGNLQPSVTFAWGGANNALSYQIQIDTTAAFLTPHINSGVTTGTQVIGTCDSSKQYFWRVRSIGQTDTSLWSTVFTFTTIVGSAPITPRAVLQMAYWHDGATGTDPWNRPATWLVWGRCLPDMSDVPPPTSTAVIAWSVYGIKYRTDWGTDTTLLYSFGGGAGVGSFSSQTLRDTLGVMADVTMRNLILLNGLQFFAGSEEKDGFLSITKPDSNRFVTVRPPSVSGEWAVTEGQVFRPISVHPRIKFQPDAGGLGYSPGDAYNAGTGAFFWGFAPGDTTYWTIYPLSSLRTQYGILTSAGIVGPKIAYLNALGQWEFKDTTGVFTSGAAADDPTTAWTFWEDFDAQSAPGLDSVASDAGFSSTTNLNIGKYAWDGGGGGGGTGAQGKIKNFSLSAAADTNHFGAIGLEAYAASATLGTPRAITISMNGRTSTSGIHKLNRVGSVYRASVKTPAAIDSTGFAAGAWGRSVANWGPASSLSTTPGIWFEYRGTGVGNDSLLAVVANGSGTTRWGMATLAVSTWYALEYRVTASGVEFYLNGSLIRTITTNLPSSTNFGSLFLQAMGYDDTYGKLFGFDYVYLRTPTTR